MQAKDSFVVSILRGMIISGILIYILPLVIIWLTMPMTEAIVGIYVLIRIYQNMRLLCPSSVNN